MEGKGWREMNQMSNSPDCSVLFWASFSGVGGSAERVTGAFPV